MEQLLKISDDGININAVRVEAAALVRKCGVRSDLRGCACLVEAIVICAFDQRASFCKIYAAVGDKFDVKQKTVMREISYAISQAFDIHVELSKLVGVSIPRTDVHSSLVIAYLAGIIRDKLLALENA